MKFHLNPKDGNLNLEQPAEFKACIKALKQRRYVLEIKAYSQTRTLTANGYYWKIVVPYFLSEMGIPKSESTMNYMHYDVLGQELRMVEDEYRPGKMRMEQTRTMTGSEFWKYIYKCEQLYQHYFTGSFPPPKNLGYDTTK